MTDGEPGYCACCRAFHLLYRREVPELAQPADVCRECIALGDGEVAWRIAGVTEGGYEAGVPPLGRKRRRPGQERLAESLILGDGGGFGSAPPRRVRLWRALVLGWRGTGFR